MYSHSQQVYITLLTIKVMYNGFERKLFNSYSINIIMNTINNKRPI